MAIKKSINFGRRPMKAKAWVYCENEFGKIDGKVAEGLA
jgi:hypothetical protein